MRLSQVKAMVAPEEALHLLSKPADRASLSTSREQTEVGHEAAERGPQLQHRLLGSNSLGRDPGHQESRIAAVGELEQRMSQDRYLESTIGSHEGLRHLPAMRKGRLDEQSRHEAECARSLGLLGFDRECFTE